MASKCIEMPLYGRESMYTCFSLMLSDIARPIGTESALPHHSDTLKTRLQTSTQHKTTLDCFRHLIRTDGVAGLYRVCFVLSPLAMLASHLAPRPFISLLVVASTMFPSLIPGYCCAAVWCHGRECHHLSRVWRGQACSVCRVRPATVADQHGACRRVRGPRRLVLAHACGARVLSIDATSTVD